MAEVVRKGPARTVRLAARGADGPEDGGEQAEHPGAAQTSGGGRGDGEEPAVPQVNRRRV